MTDLISIIIPAYNHENYIQTTLQSVLAQTYPRIELIIINDGSLDLTHERITKCLPGLKKKLTHVEYINKENEGVNQTLNLGLSKAKGSYVYTIASDDYAEPNALDTLHRFLSTNPAYGLVVGDAALVDMKNRPCYWSKQKEIVYDKNAAAYRSHGEYLRTKRRDINFESDIFGRYETLLLGNYIPNGYMIRKQLFDQIGGYSPTARPEDWHLMLQLSKYAKFKYIDQVLFHYRWHDTNTIKTDKGLKIQSKYILKNELPYICSHGLQKFRPIYINIFRKGFIFFSFKKSQSRLSIKILGMRLLGIKRTPNWEKILKC